MKLPKWLQRLRDFLAVPYLTESERIRADQHHAARVESPAGLAHRAIADAVAFYRSTHELDDTPRLHVSREAWDAITQDRVMTITDGQYLGVNQYAGCPVTVSNFQDRPGIWCDAMPNKPRRPLPRAAMPGDYWRAEEEFLNMHRTFRTPPITPGMVISDAPDGSLMAAMAAPKDERDERVEQARRQAARGLGLTDEQYNEYRKSPDRGIVAYCPTTEAEREDEEATRAAIAGEMEPEPSAHHDFKADRDCAEMCTICGQDADAPVHETEEVQP